MPLNSIATSNAAQPAGPYSQAIIANQTVYVSGCLGLEPSTNKLVLGGIVAEITQTLSNLKEILVAAGSSLEKVVKTTVFLQDAEDSAVFNEEYGKVFKNPCPARTTVVVAKLPLGALIEIDAIATL